MISRKSIRISGLRPNAKAFSKVTNKFTNRVGKFVTFANAKAFSKVTKIIINGAWNVAPKRYKGGQEFHACGQTPRRSQKLQN